MSDTQHSLKDQEEDEETMQEHETFVDSLLPHEHRDTEPRSKHRHRDGLIDLERRARFGKY